MICYCNKTKIYCLQWFPTVSLKSNIIIARITDQEKKVLLKYVVNKAINKSHLYLEFGSQLIYTRATANICNKQIFTPKQS